MSTTRRRVGGSRPSAPSCAIGGGCLAPVAAYHDGRPDRLVAAEDGSWVELRRATTPMRSAASSQRSRRNDTSARPRHRHVRISQVPWSNPRVGGVGMGPASKRLRVIVTRPRAQVEPLARRLEALGHEVVRCPLIELEPIGPKHVAVDGYDWVVVTSPFGARELLRRARGTLPNVAAIGPGTAATLAEGGVEPALVPAVSTQEGLLAELPTPAGRVLFAGAERARPLLADELAADFVPLYRTRALRPEPLPEGDLVVLASASAAGAFAALGLELPAVSIGPQTHAPRRRPASPSSPRRGRMTSTASSRPSARRRLERSPG